MSLDKQDSSGKVIIEDNYKGKRNEGRVTVSAKKQVVVDHIEKQFKLKGFKARYLADNEGTVDVSKEFDLSKPIQRIGGIEFDFFKYEEHVVVYYRINNFLGLSYLTLILIFIHGAMGGIWLAKNGYSGDAPVIIGVFFLFLMVFAYQRISNRRALKKIIVDILSSPS